MTFLKHSVETPQVSDYDQIKLNMYDVCKLIMKIVLCLKKNVTKLILNVYLHR